MINIIAIASGGAIGAVLRYLLSNGTHMLVGRGFPYGSLLVNVVGCLGMGVLYILFLERLTIAPEWRAAIQIGLLGAFTTFSTFSMETLLLFENGEAQKALINIFLNVTLCLGATWVGMIIGRQI